MNEKLKAKALQKEIRELQRHMRLLVPFYRTPDIVWKYVELLEQYGEVCPLRAQPPPPVPDGYEGVKILTEQLEGGSCNKCIDWMLESGYLVRNSETDLLEVHPQWRFLGKAAYIKVPMEHATSWLFVTKTYLPTSLTDIIKGAWATQYNSLKTRKVIEHVAERLAT